VPKPRRRSAQGLSLRKVRIRLSGNWLTGGTLSLHLVDRLLGRLRLGPVKWIFAATLIEYRQQSAGQADEHAFVPVDTFVERVRYYLGEDVEPRFYQIVSELRLALSALLHRHAPNSAAGGISVADLPLIETLSPLGYALRLPASNLHVEFLNREHVARMSEGAGRLRGDYSGLMTHERGTTGSIDGTHPPPERPQP